MELLAKLGGRKFVLAVAGVVAVALSSAFGLDPRAIMTVAGVISAYIFGQGLADGLSGGITSSNPPL